MRPDPRRLLERSVSRLTVITAPAGSGKSRLVGEWLAGLDPTRWARIDLDRGSENQLGAQLRPGLVAVVVTGLETLTDEQICELVDEMLDGLPDRARLVLVGTGNGLPAGILVRRSDDLTELRAGDLWWSRAELADQLHRLTGISATEAEVEQLFRLTAGWPAGVIILGRQMRSHPAVLELPEATASPEILDFVTVEVLNRLAPAVRGFVVRTAVLAELTADDCAVLVPGESPHVLLAEVHRQGLTAESWPTPRYHRLIRVAALRALRTSDPAAETESRRALGEHTLNTLLASAAKGFRNWQPARLRAAVQALPESVWAGDAERRALVAFAAAMSGDHLSAAQVLQQAPAGLRERAPWWPVPARLIEALGVGGSRAADAALTELQNLDRAIAVPAILGVTDRTSLIGTAHLLAARAGVFDGDPARVRGHLEAAQNESRAQLPSHFVLAGLGADALIAAWEGQLAAAQRRVARGRRLAEEAGLAEHPMLGLTLLARVELLRARGQSRSALAELDAGRDLLQRGESFVAAASGGRVHTAAARILRTTLLLDLADPVAARAEMDRLDTEGDDSAPRKLLIAMALARARWQVLADQPIQAEQLLAAAPAAGIVSSARITIALQRKALARAQELLQEWPFEESLDNRIRRLLAGAAIALGLGLRPEAEEQIDQALVAAEPDAHVRVFLDAPARAQTLVSAVLGRSQDVSGWRADLADRLDGTRLLGAPGEVLPVTRRERAVLEHLTTAMTHAQIASRLFVSENTLKSHCRNLYRKLGVNTRADAVRVARARGWLAPAGPDPTFSPLGEVGVDLNITLDPVGVEL